MFKWRKNIRMTFNPWLSLLVLQNIELGGLWWTRCADRIFSYSLAAHSGASLLFQGTVSGQGGPLGALAPSLVVTADKSACVNVMTLYRSMVANFARDPRENSITARRMTVQVLNNSLIFLTQQLRWRAIGQRLQPKWSYKRQALTHI